MGRVLLVDDEPDHCLTTQAILRRDAVDVEVASSAEEALEAMGRQRFDVAIVDLRLRDRDGLETMREMRRIQPWLQVVMLTAYPSSGTFRTALTEGAVAYLEKPYAPEALRALVATLLERSSEQPT